LNWPLPTTRAGTVSESWALSQSNQSGHQEPACSVALANVEELSRRYIRMYEQITVEKFVCGEIPIERRIERNVKAYGI
jgi:hypothetical protein